MGYPAEKNREPLQAYGQQLFDQVSEFYAWYLSWNTAPKAHAQAFELLSRIMRIAQVSKEGGLFLTQDEEQKALSVLNTLREELFNGLCHHQEIPSYLLKIIQTLTLANPKARLVARANELEYLLCVRAPAAEGRARYQLLLDHIVNQVNPQLPNTYAHAISQGLAKIIENPGAVADTHAAIQRAIGYWLK